MTKSDKDQLYILYCQLLTIQKLFIGRIPKYREYSIVDSLEVCIKDIEEQIPKKKRVR